MRSILSAMSKLCGRLVHLVLQLSLRACVRSCLVAELKVIDINELFCAVRIPQRLNDFVHGYHGYYSRYSINLDFDSLH